jgi:hypothetical protein
MALTDDMSLEDVDLIVSLACSLDMHPDKKNWVEKAGGLPEYICEIARAIKRGGKDTSSAIAIAVGRVKKWASGAGVDGKTQAKAAAALAQWEKIRAKAHADNVKLSAVQLYGDTFEISYNSLWGLKDVPISDGALALAARFEDCSRNSLSALDNILTLSRGQKEVISLSDLTTKKRKKLSDDDFALPDERRYPIHDEAHARNALARVAQHGTPEEKKKVKAAVKRKHPNIKVDGDGDED